MQEPVRLPAGECREAYIAQRVYQVRGDAAPRDVTAEVMPAIKRAYDAMAKGQPAVLDVRIARP